MSDVKNNAMPLRDGAVVHGLVSHNGKQLIGACSSVIYSRRQIMTQTNCAGYRTHDSWPLLLIEMVIGRKVNPDLIQLRCGELDAL